MASRDDTWFKCYRSLLNWEWYNDINVKVLFIHLLLIVNIESQRKRNVYIPSGSIDRTYEQLVSETGLTMQQLRTAISKLKSTGEITVEQHPNFSVFSVVQWGKFQGKQQQINRRNNSRATAEQQQINSLNKNNKEYKEIKNICSTEQEDDDDEGWIDP